MKTVTRFQYPITAAYCFTDYLGYADTRPAVFFEDRASPDSQVSAAFLFKHSLNPLLSSTGSHHAHLTVSVPSQGGYHISGRFRLLSSVTCTADIVLGVDWLASFHIVTVHNALQRPALASGAHLVARWTMQWSLARLST